MVQLLYCFPDWKDIGLALGMDMPTGKLLSSLEIAGMTMRIKAFGCTKYDCCGRCIVAFKSLGARWRRGSCMHVGLGNAGLSRAAQWWLMLKKAPVAPCSRHWGPVGAGVAASVTGSPGKGGFTPTQRSPRGCRWPTRAPSRWEAKLRRVTSGGWLQNQYKRLLQRYTRRRFKGQYQ